MPIKLWVRLFWLKELAKKYLTNFLKQLDLILCNTNGYSYNMACPPGKKLLINTFDLEFVLKTNGDLNCETASDYRVSRPINELERGCLFTYNDRSKCAFNQNFLNVLFNVTNIPDLYYPIPKRIVAEFSCPSSKIVWIYFLFKWSNKFSIKIKGPVNEGTYLTSPQLFVSFISIFALFKKSN